MFMKEFGWTFSQIYYEAEHHAADMAKMFVFLGKRGEMQYNETRRAQGKTTLSEVKSKEDLDSWRQNALARADANLASTESALRKKYGASYDRMGF